MKRSLKFPRVVLTVFAALALSLTFLAGPGTGTASAAGCRQSYYGTYNYQGNYMASSINTVPYGSACRDINIAGGHAINGNWCGNYRVRFYPSSGSSYANAWQYKCFSVNGPFSLQVIASNVYDGTRYRIETAGTTPYEFSVYD